MVFKSSMNFALCAFFINLVVWTSNHWSYGWSNSRQLIFEIYYGLIQGCFLTLSKKLKEKKPKFFGLRPKTQGRFCQKPQACGIFKHMDFFAKKLMLFKMIRLVLWYFLPKIEETAVKIAQNMQKLVIFLKYFHQNRNFWKKLKQFWQETRANFRKTQQSVQKLKQNEH